MIIFVVFCFYLVEAEIKDRAEFLEDMTRLGKDKEYKTIIATEISQVS